MKPAQFAHRSMANPTFMMIKIFSCTWTRPETGFVYSKVKTQLLHVKSHVASQKHHTPCRINT